MREISPDTPPDPAAEEMVGDAVMAALTEIFPQILEAKLAAWQRGARVGAAASVVRAPAAAEGLRPANFGPDPAPLGAGLGGRSGEDVVVTVVAVAGAGAVVSRADVLEVTGPGEGRVEAGGPAGQEAGLAAAALRNGGEPVGVLLAGPGRDQHSVEATQATGGAFGGPQSGDGESAAWDGETVVGDEGDDKTVVDDGDKTLAGDEDILSAGDGEMPAGPEPEPGRTGNTGSPEESPAADAGLAPEPGNAGARAVRQELDPGLLTRPGRLAKVVDDVADSASADGFLTAAGCVVLLGRLVTALYGQDGQGFWRVAAGAAGTADDIAVGRAGADHVLAPHSSWQSFESWDGLAKSVKETARRAPGRDGRPGGLGLVLAQRPYGRPGLGQPGGHAFGLYSWAGEEPVWIELQAPEGSRLLGSPPKDFAAPYARAVVVGRDGRVVQEALAAVMDSAVGALALTDPPVSREYGAFGIEFEAPHLSVVRDMVSVDQIPGLQEVIAYDKFEKLLKVKVERLGGKEFLEFVSEPLRIVDGDEGRADPEEFFRSFEEVLARIGFPDAADVSELFGDGKFTVTANGKHTLLKTDHDLLAKYGKVFGPQFTVGIEAGGLADFLRWIRWSMVPLDATYRELKLDIDAGLALGDDVTVTFAHWQHSGTRIPLVAAELLNPEEAAALRGYMALVFTHAMAALRHSAYQGISVGPKAFVAAALRHPISEVRAALPGLVQEFLRANAQELKGLIMQYLQRYGPQAIHDPSRVYFGLVNRHSIGHFMDSALGNDFIVVNPIEFHVASSFPLDAARRERPLILLEWRTMRTMHSVAELRQGSLAFTGAVRAIFKAGNSRRTRLLLGDRAPADVLGQVVGHPVARDTELLFRSARPLGLVAQDESRPGLDRDLFMGWVAEIAAGQGRRTDPNRVTITRHELRRVLSLLEKTGWHALDVFEADRDNFQAQNGMLVWAAGVRAARRLLVTVDPRDGVVVPGEALLTRWEHQGFGPRPGHLEGVDASVRDLLAERLDMRRLAMVLSRLRAWRRSRRPAADARYDRAADGLWQRAVYELGALAENPWLGGPPRVEDREFFGQLTAKVAARLSSREPAMAGDDMRTPAPAPRPRRVEEVYRGLAPADRGRAEVDELADQIALQMRAARRAAGQSQPSGYSTQVFRVDSNRAMDDWLATARHDAKRGGDDATAELLSRIIRERGVGSPSKASQGRAGIPGVSLDLKLSISAQGITRSVSVTVGQEGPATAVAGADEPPQQAKPERPDEMTEAEKLGREIEREFLQLNKGVRPAKEDILRIQASNGTKTPTLFLSASSAAARQLDHGVHVESPLWAGYDILLCK